MCLLRIAVAGSCIAAYASGAFADYRSAEAHYDQLTEQQQEAIVLGVIATGDFDGLIDFGFTRRLYHAVTAFEQRENLVTDGMLEAKELDRLNERAKEFYDQLGTVPHEHPNEHSRLLVPRKLFDRESTEGNWVIFSRDDRNLSLSHVAIPASEKSYQDLFADMSQASPERHIKYSRLLPDYFVVTGTFRGQKFYTWISRLPEASAGFALQWSDAWHDMGQKLAVLLANSFVAVPEMANNQSED